MCVGAHTRVRGFRISLILLYSFNVTFAFFKTTKINIYIHTYIRPLLSKYHRSSKNGEATYVAANVVPFCCEFRFLCFGREKKRYPIEERNTFFEV